MGYPNRRDFLQQAVLFSGGALMANTAGESTLAEGGEPCDPERLTGRAKNRKKQLMEAICDHFATTHTTYGRPDPTKTPFASKKPGADLVASPNLHSPPYMALALYGAAKKLDRKDYIASADLYTLYLMSVIRDPIGGKWDFYSQMHDEAWIQKAGKSVRAQTEYLLCRSAHHGWVLYTLCEGFMKQHPKETSFLSRAAAAYDHLQEFRTDQPYYFRIGYAPTGVDQGMDGAFPSDLSEVGLGLMCYYELSKRKEVLQDALGLAGYYLREHKPGMAEGCFSEEFGNWVICPWPLEIQAEHGLGMLRYDRMCWGFGTREISLFLMKLYQAIDDASVKKTIQSRVTMAMKRIFDTCQHDFGGVGIFRKDNAFTGMAAAAIMNYLDCRSLGFLTEAEMNDYGAKAKKAWDWIVSWSCEDILGKGGCLEVNGGAEGMKPPENAAWMLAWTVEAMLRSDELEEKTDKVN